MHFKEIILKLLESELDANNNDTVSITKELWSEVYSIMLLLQKMYGSSETKEILQKIIEHCQK